ncbi:putative serine protease K12H4.7 [Haematobia irritans]|uniref:putative serine protease K12H4.7 n=1 Tax=Haematobia irritans TaxID=7368 RepID=UPI003F500CD5
MALASCGVDLGLRMAHRLRTFWNCSNNNRNYMSYTMKSIKELGGLKCSNKLEDAFQSLRHKLISPSTSHALLRRLKSCQSFNPSNEMDISAFFNSLGNYFAVLVQSYSNWLPIICKSFTSNEIEPLEALVQYIEEIFSPDVEEQQVGQIHGEEWCLDLSYEGMKSIFMQDADIYSGTRCWFYQTCHEFGWFATTQALSNASSSHLFGGQVSLKFFQKLCQDVFQSARGIETVSPHGSTVITFSELNSRAERINHIFGGLMNVSQRVIFTHGLLDPWRAVGLQHGHNVLRLKGYSHVEDFGSINLKDSVEMNVAKLKVAAFINKALRN